MNPPVHILCTVRHPALLEAALLVFRTLRTGFPENPVMVWGNALAPDDLAAVGTFTQTVGGTFLRNLPATSHDAWIEQLVNSQTEPFWICDTDMVFFAAVPSPEPCLFAGRHEPEFDEEWTGTLHVERLHTCLMYLNPVALRCAIRAWQARIPSPWRDSAQFPLIRQQFIPQRLSLNSKPTTLFYDTCAGLYQALGGTPFTAEQDATFEHLHCGTYADVVDAPSLAGLRRMHRSIYENPAAARGLKQSQDAYYHERTHAKPLF